MWRKYLKSTAVGGIATLVDLAVLALFVEVLAIDARLANVPALALGVLVQFLGNKLFAFDDRSEDWARQGALFASVEAGALLLNAAVFHVASSFIPYLAARVLVQALVYLGFSLPLWSRIFQERSSS